MSALSAAETFGRVPDRAWTDSLAPSRASCLCGTVILRQPYESVADVVYRHNRTVRHRAWWERVRVAWQGDETDG